ncbi:hypothetical protein [Maribacter sp. 2304DJ31-5]|uniref:hypothetical protein n=1 Tax=Maribacter sp. 2304DJ31-5 TaxID=3386273 RepID=UPI0039BD1092
MQLKLLRLTIIIVLVTINLNCKHGNSSDSAEIFLLAIENSVKSLPPPAPPNIGDSTITISQKKIDSITKIRLNIAVSSDIINPIGAPPELKGHEDYVSIVEKLFDGKKQKLNLDFSSLKSFHDITLVDSNYERKKIFKKFNVIVSFSDISLNNSKDKAALIFRESYGKLSGTEILYLLAKVNGNWKVIQSKTLSLA